MRTIVCSTRILLEILYLWNPHINNFLQDKDVLVLPTVIYTTISCTCKYISQKGEAVYVLWWVPCFQPIHCSSPFKLCHIYLKTYVHVWSTSSTLPPSFCVINTSVSVYPIGRHYFCIYHWYVLIFFFNKVFELLTESNNLFQNLCL
jgi:hypothetical protein